MLAQEKSQRAWLTARLMKPWLTGCQSDDASKRYESRSSPHNKWCKAHWVYRDDQFGAHGQPAARSLVDLVMFSQQRLLNEGIIQADRSCWISFAAC